MISGWATRLEKPLLVRGFWRRKRSTSTPSSPACRTRSAGAGPHPPTASRGARVAWRGQAERTWPVSAERPIRRRPGARGFFAYGLKKALRPFLRWYVEPLAAEQRSYNDALLKLVDELSERADLAASREQAARRSLTELEERLARLERRPAAGGAPAPPQSSAAQTVAAQPAAAAFPDYFAYEARMRGSTDTVRERQRVYLDDFRDAAPVLDVGCGRGELLGLLREAGVEARGVDADADMVAYARGEGLDVEQADALAYLESLDDGSLGGIFAGQVVEHLPPATLLRLLQLAASKLRPGGLLVAETINPLSPLALRSYFAGPHARPAARSRDAGAAGEAGRLPRGRDALPERARRAARDPRRPDDRRERPQTERHPVRSAVRILART